MYLFFNALCNHFNLGGVHLLVFGAFGETRLETLRLITFCTCYATAYQENDKVTPLSTTIQRGTAQQVLLN